MRMTELLLGCGHSRQKRMGLPNTPLEFEDLVTLDLNHDCKPDLFCNLNDMHWLCNALTSVGESVVFDRSGTKFIDKEIKKSFFSEVHAYEVLEHLGQQGDVGSFFSTFENIYRILVPNGHLFATVPSRFSPWMWGDPGHRRAILPESLVFLDQTNYAQCGQTMMSDYRSIYKADFIVRHSQLTEDKLIHQFVLQAIKPSRIK